MKSFYTVSLSQILLRSPHKNYLGFIRVYYKKKFEKLFILSKEKGGFGCAPPLGTQFKCLRCLVICDFGVALPRVLVNFEIDVAPAWGFVKSGTCDCANPLTRPFSDIEFHPLATLK